MSIVKSEVAIPLRMRALQVDHRGYLVPWFVAWIDGKPDHRVVDSSKMIRAMRENKCWICGEPLGAFKASILGPMCAVNRTISEPPSHRECAEYSVQVCPFLSIPEKKRRERNIPEGSTDPAGNFLRRNPGVSAVWISNQVRPFKVGNGILFRVGEPSEVVWYCEGRLATRAEVDESIAGGLPALQKVANEQGDGAPEALALQVENVKRYLPTVDLP
jgi:hypothetical protein